MLLLRDGPVESPEILTVLPTGLKWSLQDAHDGCVGVRGEACP